MLSSAVAAVITRNPVVISCISSSAYTQEQDTILTSRTSLGPPLLWTLDCKPHATGHAPVQMSRQYYTHTHSLS